VAVRRRDTALEGQARSSCNVFHCPHSGHCPLPNVEPHELQAKKVLIFLPVAMLEYINKSKTNGITLQPRPFFSLDVPTAHGGRPIPKRTARLECEIDNRSGQPTRFSFVDRK